MPRSRGVRLAVREARLITKELRLLGVPSRTIAKIWGFVIGIPIVLVLGYLALNHDSGTTDPAVLSRVQITPKDTYHAHVKNNTSITLKSLTLTCSPGGDAQPVTSTTTLSTRHLNRDMGKTPTLAATARWFASTRVISYGEAFSRCDCEAGAL